MSAPLIADVFSLLNVAHGGTLRCMLYLWSRVSDYDIPRFRYFALISNQARHKKGTDDSSNTTVATKTIHLHSLQAIKVLSLKTTYHTISCKAHFNANQLIVGNDNKIPWRKEETQSHILCTDDHDDAIKCKHFMRD